MIAAQQLTNQYEDKTYSLNTSQKIQRFALQACCSAAPTLGLKVALYHFTNTRKRRQYSFDELPEKVQSRKLTYRDGHIVTHSWGDGEKIIYLVHGWESNASMMKAFIYPLLEKGFTVVAFDMPAHGHSSKQATHLNDFVATLEYVISIFGKPFGILAHSFGGTATVLLMRQKNHLLPKKLCLISPMRSLNSHLQVFNSITGLSDLMMEKLLIQLQKKYALDSKLTDIAELIGDLPIPGLLIHDEHDQLIPVEVGDYLADMWQGASYIKTQSLGHRKILKDPGVIASATDYMVEH